MYCVVDIETTGGNKNNSKITEIAIYKHDGNCLVDEFISLVNPESFIPEYISRLTGITNNMVSSAPRFFEIAKEIINITEGAVFVAHNVAFDYGVIQEEFRSLGYDFVRDTLCTVKLSRTMLPGYQSYSLGNICADLNITINGRHRAGGDAYATVKLFELIIEKNGGIVPLSDFEKPFHKETLNSNIKMNRFNDLPTMTGVYYLKNIDDEIIFIGKSKNIKSKVFNQLKGGNSKKSLLMATEVVDVDYWIAGNDLIASLKESDDIRAFCPKYNKTLKRKKYSYGLYSYKDRNGYERLVIRKSGDNDMAILTFENYDSALQKLYVLIDKYELCQKMCGLYEGKNGCFQYQLKQCKGACVGEEDPLNYNERIKSMICSVEFGYKNLVIIDRGRTADEYSVVYIENGCYCGYGFFNSDQSFSKPEDFKDVIDFKDDNRNSKNIISVYLKSGAKIIKQIPF
ncbi:MAG: exonuclease [Marinilabiliaceae bacterium]|nr:exonuclease [Marinilabiliaceae bacterium]